MIENLKLKTHPALLGFAALLCLVVTALVLHGDATWKEGAAFLAGALALPGLFGIGNDSPPKEGSMLPPPGRDAPLIAATSPSEAPVVLPARTPAQGSGVVPNAAVEVTLVMPKPPSDIIP